MGDSEQNYYGSLCTEMYEILNEKAPQDELDFYLSYAKKEMRIFEPLCGSGRFLVPFLERGYDICGMDLSTEMLSKLREKAPNARAYQSNILTYSTDKKYDYIFIASGSMSLFTDMKVCKRVLLKIKSLLQPNGVFVFALDTVKSKYPDDNDYVISAEGKTKEGLRLVLKTKHYYDEESQTQFAPGIYELYDNNGLIQSEAMDFQTHLYKLSEMEQYLKETGFTSIKVYSSFAKDTNINDECEMLVFECKAD